MISRIAKLSHNSRQLQGSHWHRCIGPRGYATVIGQIALALNGFQSELAMLFCTVMGGPGRQV